MISNCERLPRWENCTITEVNKPYAIQQWLRGLLLAGKTKTIRSYLNDKPRTSRTRKDARRGS